MRAKNTFTGTAGNRRDVGVGPIPHADEAQRTDFPIGLRRHLRYLSSFDSNVIEIAIGDKSAPKSSKRKYNLDWIFINCDSSESVYRGNIPLSQFPHLVEAAKILVNSVCERNHRGEVGQTVSSALRTFRQLCTWMIRRAVYRLADLDVHNIEQLIEEIHEHSWRRALNYNHQFAKILGDISGKPEVAVRLASSAKGKVARINSDALEALIGLPVHNNHVPARVRRAVAAVLGQEVPEDIHYKFPSPSRSEMKQTMGVLNDLALMPAPLDCITFLPFPNINKRLKELFPAAKDPHSQTKASPGQTPNMSPGDYAKAFEVFIKYVLDYGPVVCDLLEIAREGVLSVESRQADMAKLKDRLIEEHRTRVIAGLLPGPVIEGLRGENSLVHLAKTVVTAAGGLGAVCHARRANELFGVRKPFGLYFGCLTEISEFPPAFQLDVYIEKSIQDFRTFPANTLMRDAIRLLERIFVLMRPAGADIPTYAEPRSAGRHMKLFEFRELHPGGFSRAAVAFDPRPYLVQLLEGVGINMDAWDGQQMPFRRMFTTLFTRRYDLVEYPAVQAHLGHFRLDTTIPYQMDEVERPRGTSIQELHGRATISQEEESIIKALAESSIEYFKDGIRALIKGDFTGGKFSALVVPLLKHLSANASFTTLALDRKAQVIVDIYVERGFMPDPMEHNLCMVGTNARTKKLSNCYRDGSLHKSEACAAMCSGCINGWSNEAYLRSLQRDHDECLARANDESLDAGLRAQYREEANAAHALLAAERNLAITTRDKINAIVSTWPIVIHRARDSQ